MRKSHKIALAFLASVFVVAVVVGTVAVNALLNPGAGEVPMTSAPSVSPSPTPSLVSPSPLPSSPPVETPPPMSQIDGIPVHIEIRHGDDVLVNTDIVPITLEGDGKLVPPAGQAGVYYSKSDWNTIPGNLDVYRGIVAGHNVDGLGGPDVFFRLGEVKKGDVITLTYQLNGGAGMMTAEFTASADAVSAPKLDVVNSQVEAYRHIWQPADTPGRYLTVLSCDLATANPGQHALNNWVVDAIRTK